MVFRFDALEFIGLSNEQAIVLVPDFNNVVRNLYHWLL